MQVPVYGLDGAELETIQVPKVFLTPLRPDVVGRVFRAAASHLRQPKGTDPYAGERTSALSWGVGRGAARMARVKGERHPKAGQAAGVASVVGGRVAHPPRSEKKVWVNVNRKERRLAIASAIAATANKEVVQLRGHRVDNVPSFPLVVLDEIEGVNKARDLRSVFEKLGLKDDVERALRRRKRTSGKPEMRGRVTKKGKGPLFVVSEDRGLGKAVHSFPGVECVQAKDLSITHLAPGSHIGRLVVWSKSSLGNIPKGVMGVGGRIAS